MPPGPAELASVVFFIYCAATAAALERRQRNRVLLACAAGAVTVAIWTISRPWPIAREWILPPLVLLMAYWTSGALFTGPWPAAERRLQAIDRAFGIAALSARAPRIVAEILEGAYVGVYPIIPIALAIHLTLTPHPDVDRFWTVILLTDYACFAMLPWIPTRPPRTLEAGEPWRSSVRRFNAVLLGRASIGANTFPSGHAAEALAAALLVADAPPAVAAAMCVVSAAIGAGAVFGRYHYAADALAGYAVAVIVWWVV